MPPVSDATPRIRHRRRRSIRRAVIGWVVGVLVVALISGAVWLVGFSSVFAAAEVRITGVEVLSSEEVASAAEVPLGTPMARIDLDQIRERVAALPPVREVEVTRPLPDLIVITVTERTPVYAVKQNGADGYLLVDVEGVAYTTVTSPPPELLVASAANADLLADIAVVVADLPEELRDLVRSISAETKDSIELELTKGRTVVWGSADQGPLKAQVLAVLLKEKGSVYNVSAPERPAVR